MEHQKAFTRITKRVAIEKSILTYRLAARELGCSVNDAKATLQAYFESDVARERGVGAVWLLSGFLAPAPVAEGDADRMDVDPPTSTQDGAAAEEEEEKVRVKTIRLVQNQDLDAQRALFSPPPTVHLYALLPTPSLPSLSLLAPSALSLAPPAARERWRPAPESAPAYGAVTHPEGERRREKGKGKSAPAAGGSGAKGKEPVKKEEDVKPAAAAKDKGKGKKPSAAEAKKDKKKKDAAAAAADGPKTRPIGQLGGLFSRTFDEPKKAKKKGKVKASPSPSPSASEADNSDDDEQDVKPKKALVPAKRKSTSPVAARKKAPSPLKKKPSVADVVLDDDDDDEWAMDEEALLEAERAAEKTAAARKTSAGAGVSAGGAKKGETKAERQKRELEEMMKSDDTMDVDAKPARAAPSRTSSTSSAAAKPKATSGGSGAGKARAGGSGAGAAKPQQQGLGAFFKKK